MGSIIQIALAIIAFIRGWKWYAIIPLAVVFCLGVVVGITGQAESMAGFLVVADVMAMIVLAVMCVWVDPTIKARNQAITAAAEKAKQEFGTKPPIT
jgi:hypothetical protein